MKPAIFVAALIAAHAMGSQVLAAPSGSGYEPEPVPAV